MNYPFYCSLPLCMALLLAACQPHPPSAVIDGYLEAEIVHIAAEVPGRLQGIAVSEGQKVDVGSKLFWLDAAIEQTSVQEAQERVHSLSSTIKNLSTGSRAEEVAVFEGQLTQALAELHVAKKAWTRASELARSGFLSPSQADDARARVDGANARANSVRAQINSARLAARPAQIRAAQAEQHSSEARLQKTRQVLAQKTVDSTVQGVVNELFYRPGEVVPAGKPVLTVVLQNKYRARFYLGADRLAKLTLQQAITITVQGCNGSLPATIRRIAETPEYVPPVLYSRDSRDKLVFLVEANTAPTSSCQLHAGMPITVSL